MDSLAARIRRLVDGLPEGSSVTLPRKTLAEWLEDAGEDAQGAAYGPSVDVADLTVPELAEALGRTEGTIRGWMPGVEGAYKLGAEWRVSRPAWREYLDGLAKDEEEEPAHDGTADLSGWREERGIA